MKNILDEIERTKGAIDPDHDLNWCDFDLLIKSSKSEYDLIDNSFRLGYIRGVKASAKHN